MRMLGGIDYKRIRWVCRPCSAVIRWIFRRLAGWCRASLFRSCPADQAAPKIRGLRAARPHRMIYSQSFTVTITVIIAITVPASARPASLLFTSAEAGWSCPCCPCDWPCQSNHWWCYPVALSPQAPYPIVSSGCSSSPLRYACQALSFREISTASSCTFHWARTASSASFTILASCWAWIAAVLGWSSLLWPRWSCLRHLPRPQTSFSLGLKQPLPIKQVQLERLLLFSWSSSAPSWPP